MEQKNQGKQENEVNLIRILGKDLRGDKGLLCSLQRINGISWAFGNALCKVLKLDTEKKIQEVTPEEIGKIEEFMKNPLVPSFMKNRQKDFDEGEDKHISASDLRLRKDFDVKRLRKIKAYRGIRHAAGLPVRGQRTKANFRKNRKKSGAVGVKKKK
jgi:small subunit ribosomal protein S13